METDKHFLLDLSLTKITVDDNGIGSRKRIADQHVALTKGTMDRLLTYLIQQEVLTNKVYEQAE